MFLPLNSVHLNGVHYSGCVPAAEKTPRHSREDISLTALRILDERGLADLTMRHLAAELNVTPGALYWHFPNKQSILADLANRILDRAEVMAVSSHSLNWSERTLAQACALRDALLSYRDGAEVVASTLALGLGAETAHSTLAKALRGGECDDQTADRAARVLVHFILGHVSHEQQRLQYESLGIVAEHPGDDALGSSNATEEFLFGVRLLLDGLRVSHSRT